MGHNLFSGQALGRLGIVARRLKDSRKTMHKILNSPVVNLISQCHLLKEFVNCCWSAKKNQPKWWLSTVKLKRHSFKFNLAADCCFKALCIIILSSKWKCKVFHGENYYYTLIWLYKYVQSLRFLFLRSILILTATFYMTFGPT